MKLTAELRPIQTITPQLIGTMTILSYSAQELEDYLVELSCENPLAELVRPQEAPQIPPSDFAQQLRWLRQSDRQNRSYYQPEDLGSAPVAAQSDATLADALRDQLLTHDLSVDLRHGLSVLIAALDDHGFYSGCPEELSQMAGINISTAAAAIRCLKSLEPAGVGARDITECLLLQLRRLPQPTQLAQKIVCTFGLKLGAMSTSKLAQQLSVSPAAIEAALDQIRKLSPYPANGFSSGDQVIYVRPDLFVRENHGQLSIVSNENAVSSLQISSQYLRMLERESDPEVQQYLHKKLTQLHQVLRDMGNRQSTMLRCGQVILERQRAFFLGGSLQKMTLRDVAQELEVHESTVSRTVRDKYISCPRGILPMSSFFSRSAGQNPTLGRENIKSALQALIAAEDPAHPSSDQTLVSQLSARHITISRRAVAKYRAELGILPASARKQA